MAKAPWFPFYTGDFLASTDVQLMEAHEVGAYLLLLAHSWQGDAPGYLPNDEGRLRRLARLSADQWKESRELLLGKWPAVEDASLRCNPRLVKEAGKQVELRETKAEAGRKSAERRARMATEAQHKGNTIPTGVENTATGVGEKGNYSQSQPQSQSQEGKPSSSLRSEGAPVGAASGPEKKIEGEESQPENPDASAPHTGGAIHVGTSPHGGKPAKPAARFVPPAQPEVLAYMQQQRPQNLPPLATLSEKWHAHYSANGWKVGKNPMKDWQAACRTWLADIPNTAANNHYNSSNGSFTHQNRQPYRSAYSQAARSASSQPAEGIQIGTPITGCLNDL